MDQGDLSPNTSNQQLVNSDNDSATALLHEKQERRSDSLRDVTFVEYMTIGILCFVNLINYMDRFTLAGVLTDVKTEFQIGDDKAGFLQTAFVVAYMIFAPIFGYLGDRYSRRAIMSFGVLLWSLTTLFGSFLTDFTWFAFFRGLVGIGEASYSTIAPTIIGDLFVGNVRSKMLAIFYFAIPVGSGLGYIVGSVAGGMAGDWRWGLRVTPVLGTIAVALIALVMKDPERGAAEDSHMKATSYTDDLKSLFKNPSFMLCTIAFTCVTFVTGALAWWGPQFIFLGLNLQEGTEIPLENVSYKFGLVCMFAGATGVPLGAWAAGRARRRWPDADPLICGLALLLSTPLIYFALIAVSDHAALSFLLMFLGMVILNVTWSIVADIVLVLRKEFRGHRPRDKVFKRGNVARRVSLYFGAITMASGLVGVPLGSWLGAGLVKSYPRAHPIICGAGLLLSAPALVIAISISDRSFYAQFFFMMLAEVTLNLNWGIVADMSLYVVIPPRRSTSEAFLILISHMFGDAGSPYLVGVISESLKKSLSPSPTEAPTASVQFRSLQYSLFMTCFVEVIGGVFFLITAIYIIKDKLKVDRAIAEAEAQRRELSHSSAQDNTSE